MTFSNILIKLFASIIIVLASNFFLYGSVNADVPDPYADYALLTCNGCSEQQFYNKASTVGSTGSTVKVIVYSTSPVTAKAYEVTKQMVDTMDPEIPFVYQTIITSLPEPTIFINDLHAAIAYKTEVEQRLSASPDGRIEIEVPYIVDGVVIPDAHTFINDYRIGRSNGAVWNTVAAMVRGNIEVNVAGMTLVKRIARHLGIVDIDVTLIFSNGDTVNVYVNLLFSTAEYLQLEDDEVMDTSDNSINNSNSGVIVEEPGYLTPGYVDLVYDHFRIRCYVVEVTDPDGIVIETFRRCYAIK